KFPPVSSELAAKLVRHKKSYPEIDIVFITDEVNTNYNSAPNPLLEKMKAAGITVVITDVNKLRDSTPLYSAVWRTFFQWFGQSGKGTLPNLMADGGPPITVRSYLKLLNVKANHRKVVVTENTALITSANVHDASVYHSNIALEAGGEMIKDVLAAEQAAVQLTTDEVKLPEYNPQPEEERSSAQKPLGIRYLTEGKVYKYVLEGIQQAEAGDVLWMGMFYLAEGKVMDELVDAAKRGVDVRLILDPNQNAFGRDKIGIPNRPAAAELLERSEHSIGIRWYNTGKEQYHTKLLFIAKPSGKSIILGGSTNFTPRNLKDYNLENNLWVEVPSIHPLKKQLDAYFDKQWFNRGAEFTLEYSAYEEKSTWIKSIVFRLQKVLGLTTF
uniref:phospholipase D-like domain-containing protein n=1 Tax=Paenibacillus dakarensis TaxID=1527293 RepID=UPI0006D547D6